ncbi:hypothetical protein MPSEU_000487700 [Mayamaea pseudoterrestris]|nr:hypothetical protein MPSEU_000487700 [Mayamaea pseudoterrestris]
MTITVKKDTLMESTTGVTANSDKDVEHADEQNATLKALQTDGFIILSGILSQEECSEAISLMWDFVEDTSSGEVDRNNAKSWYADMSKGFNASSKSVDDAPEPWPSCRSIGENHESNDRFDCNGAGWLLGSVREILAERVFGPLYDTDRLHCSKEGFIFRRPKHEIDCHKSALVRTISKAQNCYSSRLYTRALVVFEDQSVGIYSGLTNDCHVNPTFLPMMRGDVLLFQSDMTLCENETLHVTPTFRPSFLCTIQPSKLTTPSVMARKVEAYRLRATGDHRPDEEICCTSYHSHDHSRPFYRTSPPLVTVRQAKLYGLLPYSDDPVDRERALVQGVRFQPEHMPTRPRIRPSAARLEYLYANDCDGEEMVGQDKYLGGMASPCGRFVYGVPGSAKRVLRINSESGAIDFIGPPLPGKFKWLRGVEVPANVMDDERYPDGCCFALPCNATTLLKINPHNNNVSTFGNETIKDCGTRNGWLYHGGNLATNGYIYAIPANARRVLRFHPVTEDCVLIGPDFGDGLQKWYGGISGVDNSIYGIPHNARFVLKIDPSCDEVTVMDNPNCQIFQNNQWKWHGGLRAGDKIIGFPNNADDVLVINVLEQSVYTIGLKDDAGNKVALRSGRHRVYKGTNKYKYLGGSLTLDGRYAFLVPCDAEQVLRVDIFAEELKLVGPLLMDGPNKFQNGFTGRDGCCYGVPQRATGVLRITPAAVTGQDDHVDILDCGPMSGVKDKFEGGVLSNDGTIFCIPLRAKACVKIIPPRD